MRSISRTRAYSRISDAMLHLRAVLHSAARLRSDTRGNILVIFAIALPLMLGTLGLAMEGANWYQTKRALQNAADEAVVAAATNATSTYLTEAKAVSSQYGYTDGSANVTVTASNSAACPSGGSTCYSVTVTKAVPLLLMQAVGGFAGNTTVNGKPAELISATAYATQQTAPRDYCMLALATSAPNSSAVEFTSNGAPKADLGGCNIMSNASMNCNGHDLNATFGDAVGTSQDCGKTQTSNMPRLTDPYSSLASNIPTNTCSSTDYKYEPAHNNDPPLPSTNQLSGTTNLGTRTYCGDVQLTGNVVLTGTNVIVIRNGQLDTNGFSITTDTGAAATIIFSGTNSGVTVGPTGGGSINISSPTSGTWSGVAIYEDPSLTSGVNMSAAGNTPSWNISGLVYAPHATVTFSGIVGKSTSGHACFVMVVDSITINGTGSILDRGDCSSQGLIMPSSQVGVRGRLVA